MAFVFRSKRPLDPLERQPPLEQIQADMPTLKPKQPIKGSFISPRYLQNHNLNGCHALKIMDLAATSATIPSSTRQNNCQKESFMFQSNTIRCPFKDVKKQLTLPEEQFSDRNSMEIHLKIKASIMKIDKAHIQRKILVREEKKKSKKCSPNINLLAALSQTSYPEKENMLRKELNFSKREPSRTLNSKGVKAKTSSKKRVETKGVEADLQLLRLGRLPSLRTVQRKHLSSLQKHQVVGDEDATDDEEQATPGPGSYNLITDFKKKDFRSKKQQFKKIFISPVERFPQSKEDAVCEQILPDEPKAKKNKLLHSSFASKTQKISCPIPSDSPAPGQYETRQSLEYDLARKVLLSSNKNAFLSGEPKLKEPQQSLSPGPCAYSPSLPTFKVHALQEFHRQIAKPPLKQDLSSELVSLITDENIPVIHVRQDFGQPFNYMTSPPFMVSSDRFKEHAKDAPVRIKSPSPPSKMQSKREPFNSSQKRQLWQVIGDGVGVGLYDLKPIQGYGSKRSFNLLFN